MNRNMKTYLFFSFGALALLMSQTASANPFLLPLLLAACGNPKDVVEVDCQIDNFASLGLPCDEGSWCYGLVDMKVSFADGLDPKVETTSPALWLDPATGELDRFEEWYHPDDFKKSGTQSYSVTGLNLTLYDYANQPIWYGTPTELTQSFLGREEKEARGDTATVDDLVHVDAIFNSTTAQ